MLQPSYVLPLLGDVSCIRLGTLLSASCLRSPLLTPLARARKDTWAACSHVDEKCCGLLTSTHTLLPSLWVAMG